MRFSFVTLACCLLSAQCCAAACIAVERTSSERVTVEQLEKIVAQEHSDSDKKATQRLDGIELTERLSDARLAHMKEQLPGSESQQKLLVIADASEFLNLPAADILHRPAPDLATQGKIISRAADFVLATVQKMPNFMATRVTSRFRDFTPTLNAGDTFVVTPDRYHLSDRDTAPVRYRNGKEEADVAQGKKSNVALAQSPGVTNLGFFGPLLGVVMSDILAGRIGWGHWENGASGPVAVFRYVVLKDHSKFTIYYCCYLDRDAASSESELAPPYHGEIAIDPESGDVLRLVVEAELKPPSLISRADVFIEYGAIQIGKRTYICPLKSVSIATGAVHEAHGEINMLSSGTRQDVVSSVMHTAAPPINRNPAPGTFTGPIISDSQVTWINDVVFEDYHVFASEMRVVPDGGLE